MRQSLIVEICKLVGFVSYILLVSKLLLSTIGCITKLSYVQELQEVLLSRKCFYLGMISSNIWAYIVYFLTNRCSIKLNAALIHNNFVYIKLTMDIYSLKREFSCKFLLIIILMSVCKQSDV